MPLCACYCGLTVLCCYWQQVKQRVLERRREIWALFVKGRCLPLCIEIEIDLHSCRSCCRVEKAVLFPPIVVVIKQVLWRRYHRMLKIMIRRSEYSTRKPQELHQMILWENFWLKFRKFARKTSSWGTRWQILNHQRRDNSSSDLKRVIPSVR